jgi:PadR family transcriptional regulator, regulatory protein PadR
MSDVLGLFEQAVLMAVLRFRGDGYGRTILKDVEARLGRAVTASAVYTTLDRLEDKGFVASRAGEGTPARGGRAKRHFSITGSGVRALNDARAAAEQIWRGHKWPLTGRT